MPLLIDIRKLSLITELIQHGAEEVAGSLATLGGVDASVDIKSLSFVQPDDIATEMGRSTAPASGSRSRPTASS